MEGDEGGLKEALRNTQVLERLEAMFQKACQDEVSKEQARRLGMLLDLYQAVFSRNGQNVEKTDLVKHSIPVQEGTHLIRQSPTGKDPRRSRRKNARYKIC